MTPIPAKQTTVSISKKKRQGVKYVHNANTFAESRIHDGLTSHWKEVITLQESHKVKGKQKYISYTRHIRLNAVNK